MAHALHVAPHARVCLVALHAFLKLCGATDGASGASGGKLLRGRAAILVAVEVLLLFLKLTHAGFLNFWVRVYQSAILSFDLLNCKTLL